MKRHSSPRSLTPPTSLEAPISPPRRRIQVHEPIHIPQDRPRQNKEPEQIQPLVIPNLAAIEAGEAEIRDHLSSLSEHLGQAARTHPVPPLSILDFVSLYRRNQHIYGRHFVVHQHDHPVAGSVLLGLQARLSQQNAESG